MTLLHQHLKKTIEILNYLNIENIVYSTIDWDFQIKIKKIKKKSRPMNIFIDEPINF